MSDICVDSGFVLAAILSESDTAGVSAQIGRWAQKRDRLIAPPLFQYEIHSVLNQRVRSGEIGSDQRTSGWESVLKLGIVIEMPEDLWKRAWELADRLSQRHTYDMHYLALAEQRNCELWTLDEALLKLVKGGPWRVRTV